MSARALALGALIPALASAAAPATKRFSIVFTGDNAGEVAVCGCKHNPTGGLARRKTVLKKLRDAGTAVLVVDAGNALYGAPAGSDDKGKARASFIMKTMGELGTTAMAVGAHDLVVGPDVLAASAQRAGVALLSANLARDGKPIFPASKVVTVSGVKVGLVGVSPVMGSMVGSPGVASGLPVAAALTEGRKLRPTVDLLVALAGVPFADAVQLSKEGQGVFDLVIESGDQMQAGVMQRNDANFVLSSGERGRAMGILEVDLSGTGPLVDVAEIERDRLRLQNLNTQIEEMKRRALNEKDPALAKSYQQTLTSFEDQVRQLKDKNLDLNAKGLRTLRLRSQVLDESVADDPALKAAVDKL